MKAIILAAGRGSRLKPLTDKTPKPLITVGSQYLVERNFDMLKQAGIREVVMNVCHHAKTIIETLGHGQRFGMDITYSYECDTALGTGGGICQALALLGDAPFMVVSADVWSEFIITPSFLRLAPQHEAHLLFVDNPTYHPAGDYSLNRNGAVGFGSPKLTYAGMAIIHPRLFLNCAPGTVSLSPLFNAAIKRSTVTGERYQGVWFNVGTITELEALRKTVDKPV